MNQYEVFFRYFYALIWFQGGLLTLVGAIYIVSAYYNLGTLSEADRKRIGLLLGLMMLTVGVQLLATGWAKGISTYVRNYDAPWLGYVAFTAAGINGLAALSMAITSIVRWWRVKTH